MSQGQPRHSQMIAAPAIMAPGDGRPQVLRLVITLAVAAGWLAGLGTPVQIIYTADPAPSFVDGDPPTPYVLGFGREGDPLPPAPPNHRTVAMRSANGTHYRCYIPQAASSSGSSSDGSSISVSTASKGSLSSQKSPSELLEALGEHCYYRIEEWWTYELCYKKHLRQYHKEGGKVVSQYLLGSYEPADSGSSGAAGGGSGAEGQQQQKQQQLLREDDVQVDPSDVTGATRYVSQQYGGGDLCKLTGKPRQAEVRFTCGGGAETLLASIKELVSCHYVATISTPRLCKHPAFQRQHVPAALIQCHVVPPGEGGAAGAAEPAVAPAAAPAAGEGSQAAGAAEAAAPAAAPEAAPAPATATPAVTNLDGGQCSATSQEPVGTCAADGTRATAAAEAADPAAASSGSSSSSAGGSAADTSGGSADANDSSSSSSADGSAADTSGGSADANDSSSSSSSSRVGSTDSSSSDADAADSTSVADNATVAMAAAEAGGAEDEDELGTFMSMTDGGDLYNDGGNDDDYYYLDTAPEYDPYL